MDTQQGWMITKSSTYPMVGLFCLIDPTGRRARKNFEPHKRPGVLMVLRATCAPEFLEHEGHKECTKNTTSCPSWSFVFFVFLYFWNTKATTNAQRTQRRVLRGPSCSLCSCIFGTRRPQRMHKEHNVVSFVVLRVLCVPVFFGTRRPQR